MYICRWNGLIDLNAFQLLFRIRKGIYENLMNCHEWRLLKAISLRKISYEGFFFIHTLAQEIVANEENTVATVPFLQLSCRRLHGCSGFCSRKWMFRCFKFFLKIDLVYFEVWSQRPLDIWFGIREGIANITSCYTTYERLTIYKSHIFNKRKSLS